MKEPGAAAPYFSPSSAKASAAPRRAGWDKEDGGRRVLRQRSRARFPLRSPPRPSAAPTRSGAQRRVGVSRQPPPPQLLCANSPRASFASRRARSQWRAAPAGASEKSGSLRMRRALRRWRCVGARPLPARAGRGGAGRRGAARRAKKGSAAVGLLLTALRRAALRLPGAPRAPFRSIAVIWARADCC